MVHRHLLIAVQILFVGDELDDLDALKRPPVRLCAGEQFLFGLRKSDVEASLAEFGPLHEVLQGQRRLAGAGIAFDEIEPVRDETPMKDVIKSANSSF